MIGLEFVEYLEDTGHGTMNEDLFVGFQPDVPDNCITIYDETAPALPESQSLSVDLFGIQIIVRNTSYQNATSKLMSIHKQIVGFGGDTLITGGEQITSIEVVTPPTSIGKDTKERDEWTAHYVFRIVTKDNIYRL